MVVDKLRQQYFLRFRKKAMVWAKLSTFVTMSCNPRDSQGIRTAPGLFHWDYGADRLCNALLTGHGYFIKFCDTVLEQQHVVKDA